MAMSNSPTGSLTGLATSGTYLALPLSPFKVDGNMSMGAGSLVVSGNTNGSNTSVVTFLTVFPHKLLGVKLLILGVFVEVDTQPITLLHGARGQQALLSCNGVIPLRR